MTGAEATLLAAIIAASVAGAGFLWSIISFVIVRRSQRATDAREQWSDRFEKAHALALSADPREARTGLLLIEGLAKEKWVTDEDKATAVSILSSLSPGIDSRAAQVRNDILGGIGDPAIAAELAKSSPGPKGRFELYVDRSGEHRWRLKSADGEVIALSAEGYSTRIDALRAIDRVRRQGGGDAAATTEAG